jgi:hypothetical protein
MSKGDSASKEARKLLVGVVRLDKDHVLLILVFFVEVVEFGDDLLAATGDRKANIYINSPWAPISQT